MKTARTVILGIAALALWGTHPAAARAAGHLAFEYPGGFFEEQGHGWWVETNYVGEQVGYNPNNYLNTFNLRQVRRNSQFVQLVDEGRSCFVYLDHSAVYVVGYDGKYKALFPHLTRRYNGRWAIRPGYRPGPIPIDHGTALNPVSR